MSFFSFFGGVTDAYNQREASKREAIAREREMEKASQINLRDQKKIIELKTARDKETEKRALAIKILTTPGYDVKSLAKVPVLSQFGMGFQTDSNGNIVYTTKTVTRTESWTNEHITWAQNYLGSEFAGMLTATGSSNTSGTGEIPSVDPNLVNKNSNSTKQTDTSKPLGSNKGFVVNVDGTVAND